MYTKAINYTGQKLKGHIYISKKIDGVRLLYRKQQYITRNNKIPPGLDKALTSEAKQVIRESGDCEIYKDNFFLTNSLLQRHNPPEGSISSLHIYPLTVGTSGYDNRLHITAIYNPVMDEIHPIMEMCVAEGYEGLVLRSRDSWYRYKPKHTADVKITAYREQKDKFNRPKGVLGGFNSNYGWVTGFTDVDRVELWVDPGQYIGRIMEVEYKEILHTGKFRFGIKFLRIRDDKDTESL